jgi:hypothetical protein
MSNVNNGSQIEFEGGPAGLVKQADGTWHLAYRLRHDGEERKPGQTFEVEGTACEVLSYATSKIAKNMVVLTLKPQAAEPAA